MDYKENGLYPYHLQSLTTTHNGTLLAFAEGRIDPADDGAHNIVLKRSMDGGVTWGNNQNIVISTAGESYGNPTVVIDRNTSKIFLFYAENFNNKSTKIYYKTSANDGVLWSNPIEITSLFNNDPYARPFHLPGPGHGIQLSDGRLMIQVWHRTAIYPKKDNTCCDPPAGQRQYGVSVIYSDNGGADWISGGYTPLTGNSANESRVVELSNGNLVLNARDAVAGLNRFVFRSTDRGASWSTSTLNDSLSPSSAVDSSMRRFTLSNNNNFNRILFSRPVNPISRMNLMVSLSYTETDSWSFSQSICNDHSTYSDMAVSNDKSRIFVLYGRGGAENSAFPNETVLARFNLEWLTGGRDSVARTGSTIFVPTYEAENLHIVASSGDETGIVDDSSASGGKVRKYLSNALNDFITFNIHAPQAGTYNIKVKMRRATNRAIVQLNVNGTNRGATINPESTTVDYAIYNIGNVPLSAGINTFKFTAVGSTSGGYGMFFDSIILAQQ